MTLTAMLVAGLALAASEEATVEMDGAFGATEMDRCATVGEIIFAAYDGFEMLKGEDLTPDISTDHVYSGTAVLLASQRCQITDEGAGPVYSCSWRLSEDRPLEESFLAITASVEDCLDQGIVGEPITFMSGRMIEREELGEEDLSMAEVGAVTRTYGRDDKVTGKIRFSATTLLYPSISVSFYPY